MTVTVSEFWLGFGCGLGLAALLLVAWGLWLNRKGR